MEKINLQAYTREEVGKSKVNALRKSGYIPAVLYGAEINSLNIKLKYSDFLEFIHQHRIETALINLMVKEENKKTKEYTCMVKEIQFDPLTDEIIHVDFTQISLSKVLKVKVPVIPKGEPIGVKQEGGVLNRLLWELEIECLPLNIPQQIEIDVSNLKLNESIQVKDIGSLGEGIKILIPLDTIVFTVTPPLKEEVAVEETTEEKLEPEVIREKKETSESKSEKEETE